jgi:hypothetical protein
MSHFSRFYAVFTEVAKFAYCVHPLWPHGSYRTAPSNVMLAVMKFEGTNNKLTKQTPWLVHKRTIPTERPPLVGEI